MKGVILIIGVLLMVAFTSIQKATAQPEKQSTPHDKSNEQKHR